eukprot:8947035-Alexandrium_andersonii.AAC.1
MPPLPHPLPLPQSLLLLWPLGFPPSPFARSPIRPFAHSHRAGPPKLSPSKRVASPGRGYHPREPPV